MAYRMVIPSTGSTLAFVLVVVAVVLAYVGIFVRGYSNSSARIQAPAIALSAFGVWIGAALLLASSGVLAELLGSPKLSMYLVASNGLALALALSPAGRRIVDHTPIAWLVGFQAFRLPLELVLHSWYEQGTLPIQMTYAGHNFDIVSGVLGLVVGVVLGFARLKARTRWWLVLGFNVVGFGLLLTVVSIAMRSTPWALRTYTNDPPVLLIAYAPYTLILPVCVAGALWGHVLVFRWLWRQRAATTAPLAEST